MTMDEKSLKAHIPMWMQIYGDIMFITFEGIEGCGKTTQIELLYTYLQGKGHSVIKTREPGGTAFGESLRSSFLNTATKVYPLSELLVFMAMRAQHVDELILPALKEGTIVLCDRFTDASYAYQGYGRGIDLSRHRDTEQARRKRNKT